MAFASFADEQSADGELAEINMIPLIDVMLVLLVIFIVTAPLLTHAVKVELPQASSAPNLSPPETVQIAIDAAGAVYWNAEPLPADALAARLAEAAARNPQPELALRADRATRYEAVAGVMSAAARAGLSRIGFVTEPEPTAGGGR
jgi:biopolymer transport protein ExbD